MKFRWIILLIFCARVSQAAQTTFSAAGNGSPVASQAGTARSVAMGGAFVAVAGDASALVWNPAGLAKVKGPEIGLHHNAWLADVTQESLLYAMPLGEWGGFGVGGHYANWGTFERRDNTGAVTGTYQDNDFGAVLGWGRQMLPGIALGAGAEVLQQSLGGQAYSDTSGRLGIGWEALPALRLAAAVSGGSSQARPGSLSSTFKLGGAYALPMGDSTLLLAGGYSYESGVSRFPLGFEALLREQLALRAGYLFNLQDNQAQGLNGLAMGAGFKMGGLDLDYAFQPFGDLGNSQRAGLTWHFSPSASPRPDGSALEATRLEGNRLLLAGEYYKAILRYQAVLNASPGHAAAWRGLGNAYYKLQDKPGAIHAFEKSLELDSTVAELRTRLADYKRSGRDEAAERLRSDAVRAEARELVLAGRVDEAVEAYKVSLHLNQGSAPAWQGLGNSYYLAKKKSLAVRAFEKSLELDPSNTQLRQKLDAYKAAP